MKTKLILIAVLLGACLYQHTAAQRKYDTYKNTRFDYEIQYPSDLLAALGEPDNADGQIFRSKDKSVELYVWGQYNALERTLEYEFNKDLKRKNIRYKLLSPDSYVISRTEKGNVYYQKTMLLGTDGDAGSTFATFVLTYPVSKKAKFDSVVKGIVISFKFD